MINTAMILAAGRGERMRPLTDKLPKPLLKVAGKMLIEYHLEKLAAIGIERVIINHAWLGEKVEEALGDGSRWNLQIHYSAEKQALETAGGIINAMHKLVEDNPSGLFVLVNGDVFSDLDYATLPQDLKGKLAHLVMVENPIHNPDGDFYFEDNLLHSQGEKALTYAGIGLYDQHFFAGLLSGVQPLGPLLRQAIETNQISAQQHRGLWSDVGTPERLTQINQSMENRL